MLIYLENLKNNTFVEINRGLSICTMRTGKIGEKGFLRTYANEAMATKLVALKKKQGYVEVEQAPKYKIVFVSTNEKKEYLLFEKRVVIKYSYDDVSHILNFANFELVINYMKERYFYDIIEGNASIEYADYTLDEFKKLSYFDMKKERLEFAENIKESLVKKSYEVKNSLIVEGDVNIEEDFTINCEYGKFIFHFQNDFKAKTLFVMENRLGIRELNIFVDGDLEVDIVFLLCGQNLIVKGEVKVNTLIYCDAFSSVKIPKSGVQKYISTSKDRAVFKTKYFSSGYGLEIDSLQKAMLEGQDVYCSDPSSLELRDKVFKAIPMLLEEDWTDSHKLQSKNISIWDRWLYTTGDEHLLNDMSDDDSVKYNARFLKFHTLILDKYEVLFANPIVSDDWQIYKEERNEILRHESLEDTPMFIVVELKLIYFMVGDYTSVVYFADEELVNELDELVSLAGLEYVK